MEEGRSAFTILTGKPLGRQLLDFDLISSLPLSYLRNLDVRDLI